MAGTCDNSQDINHVMNICNDIEAEDFVHNVMSQQRFVKVNTPSVTGGRKRTASDSDVIEQLD